MHVSDSIATPLPRPTGRPANNSAPRPEPTDQVEIGKSKEFWVWDTAVMPPGNKRIEATCRAVGQESYVFVDNAVWNRLVTDADVKTIDERFENHSPAGSVDPSKGIAANDQAYFGRPALGLDQDQHTYILLTEFGKFNGTTMDGMVNSFDTIPDKEAWEQYQQHSNEAEIVYLNSADQSISGDYMQAVLAHEYQHVTHNAADPEEESWLNEMVSEVAMKINGYHTDLGHAKKHLARPELPLVSQTYVDYGACFLFGTYLLEKFGKNFFQELVANPQQGIQSVDSTLEKMGHGQRFNGLCQDWFVANYADHRNVSETGFHYATLDLPKPCEIPLTDKFQGDLGVTGARYFVPAQNRYQLKGDGLDVQLLQFNGGKMERSLVKPDENGVITLPEGPDRVLVVGNLGNAKTALELTAVA